LPPKQQAAPDSPFLSELIQIFLENEGKRDIGPMMKKHNAVLPMFLEFVGNKQVSHLRQKSDIVDFLEMVMRLPPRWKDIHDKQKLSARQIAEQSHPVTIAEGTFAGTYRASVSMFLDWAMTNYQDEGFPTSLTVSKIGYHGARKRGTQQKQRALTLDELKRLFEGPEMAAIAADPACPGRFWLPHVLLFTGARINEICQVNPQTDIRQDLSSIWFIRITEEEGDEDDEGVTKSVKTGTTREVPIHHALTELGFIKYVERVKAAGAKVLFPEWKPRAGRASVNAERWFNRHLREIGLHGVKNAKGHAIRGAHAFRHSLLTYGSKQGLNLRPISGHVEKSDNKVADGYEDETIIAPLGEKKRLLDQLDYGIKFFMPVEPRPSRTV
jgi:integrase